MRKKCFVVSALFCLIGFANTGYAQDGKTKIAYEILNFQSRNSIIVWLTTDITQEEFDALELPLGWFKNQPRESEPDANTFENSPGQDPGNIVEQELFGFTWKHVATVKQVRVRLDFFRRLKAAKVEKSHKISFAEGRTLTLLVSPEGDVYPRVSRDANRTSEEPKIPDNWDLLEYQIDEPLEFRLPDETLVIRTDNKDSFQGPVDLNINE